MGSKRGGKGAKGDVPSSDASTLGLKGHGWILVLVFCVALGFGGILIIPKNDIIHSRNDNGVASVPTLLDGDEAAGARLLEVRPSESRHHRIHE